MKNKHFPLIIYLLIHLTAIFCFAFSALKGRFFITSDLFSMIPKTSATSALEIADKKLTGNSSKSVFILSRNEDFATAKKNAELCYNKITQNPDFPQFFESLTLYSEMQSYQDIFEYIREYRHNLLDDKTIELLQAKHGQEEFAETSLAGLFSGFSMAPLDDLENDPYFLDELHLKNLMQILNDTGTSMSLKDGVLTALYEDQWFVMIQGVLTDKGAALAKKKNGISLIYDICLPLENETSASFVFSGTPFHSHKSSTSASLEISLISTISLIAVLAMLIFVFRSPLPIFAAFNSIIIALIFAFSVTAAVFGQIHALTLVFGTSLIGSCIDYSLHFFVNWKANHSLNSGNEIRCFLKKGLVLSLISTELCYFLLMFAPFPLLKQMAVFSFSGIMSSFLSVMLIYPLFKLPEADKRNLPVKIDFSSVKIRRYVIPALIVIPLAIIAVKHQNVKIKNNLSALYKMQGRLKEDTILSSKVLNYTPSSWFIIQAETEEELLVKEEDFSKRYPDQKFLCTSRFIPSKNHQLKSINADLLLAESDLTNEQYDILGFEDSAELSANYLNNVISSRENLISPENTLPSSLEHLKNLLWLGQIEGKYYSVFLPVSDLSTEELEQLSDSQNGIFYENKVQQISTGLDKLSKMILLMFAVSFVIITALLRLFFSARETLKIAAVPLLSILWITAVFSLTETPIDFFCTTGIILVFGLGIDYIIYMTGHKGGPLEKKAIILSFLTTAISFGALALSSFVPVHAIGLSIFTGLTAAFIATMFI